MSATTYFHNLKSAESFDPEAHEWLAMRDGLYLFPLKASDTWTQPPHLEGFKQVPNDQVPSHVRRKTGQRYGAWKRKKGPK